MGHAHQSVLVAVLLFVGMLVLLEVGRRAQARRQLREPLAPD